MLTGPSTAGEAGGDSKASIRRAERSSTECRFPAVAPMNSVRNEEDGALRMGPGGVVLEAIAHVTQQTLACGQLGWP